MVLDLKAIISASKNSDTSKRQALDPDFAGELQAVSRWLAEHRLTDIDVLAFGGDAVAFSSRSNPDIVIRMGTNWREQARSVVPQVLQPIFSVRIMGLPLEIIPRLDTKAVTSKHAEAFCREMEKAYAADGKMLRGYDIRRSHLPTNLGLFHYRNAQGRKKSVPMTYDPAVVTETMRATLTEEDGSVYTTDGRPKCTRNYPTFQDQRRRQLEIIRGDERLQALVGKEGELLEPYPKTIIVPAALKGAER
jgi:hypothetical protein